jgi:hypothetical protein
VIPPFVDIGAPWKVLPPGLHDATLDEVEARYAYNEKRRTLFTGFRKGCEALQKAGCNIVYLDGSYITEKEKPGDFDALWETDNVDGNKLDPVLLDFEELRKKQKEKFHGEFFPSSFFAEISSTRSFLDFFQVDRDTGIAKGIIRICLDSTMQRQELFYDYK